MPWLTIIMAVLAFFLTGGAKKENRGKAALAALAAGAGTYYTTHHTERGQENLGQWDGVEVNTDGAGGSPEIATGPGKPPTPVFPKEPGESNSGGSGF